MTVSGRRRRAVNKRDAVAKMHHEKSAQKRLAKEAKKRHEEMEMQRLEEMEMERERLRLEQEELDR